MDRPQGNAHLPFQRVAVLRAPGSGKSTLSEAWGRVTGLPVLHVEILRMLDEEPAATPRVVLEGRLSVEALCAIVKTLR